MASAVACKGAAPASLLNSGAPVAFCALHSPAVTADRRPYNGGSGYCYLIDFPVETVVYEADDWKVGYFKIRKAQQQSAAVWAMSPGVTVAVVVVSLVLASLAVAGAYIGWERWLRQRRASSQGMEQELTPGHYRDLKSMDSPNNSF